MKRTLNTKLLLLWIMVIPLLASAQGTKSISVSFKQDDFKLSFNEKHELVISTTTLNAGFGDNLAEPALPMVSKYVLIPRNHKFADVNVETHRTLVMEDVVMALNPIALPTDGSMAGFVDTRKPDYKPKTYPDNTVNYVDKYVMTGHNILGFLLSPFEYDAAEKKLYFHENFQLDIQLAESETLDTMPVRNHMNDIISSMVKNPGEILGYGDDEILQETSDDTYEEGAVDYIIITCDSLKDAFTPLVNWKITKGVRTKVATIEQIAGLFDSGDLQLRIKKYLKSLYVHNELKYALIALDDISTIRGCHVNSDYHIPTDIYYACFDGNFEWNANQNSFYGETDDGNDLSPEIYVTRAPIKTNAHATAFVNKVLYCEQTPTQNGWQNRMMMCGSVLGGYVTTSDGSVISDVQAKAERLYSTYIQGKWDLSRVRVFDTYTDYSPGAAYDFTAPHVILMLNSQYAYFDVMTHGSDSTWRMENRWNESFHSVTHVPQVVNPQPTVITTIACETNAFDDRYMDPCLSEAFIRSPTSGVVAYLGCSRNGWDTYGGSLGTSSTYDALFYQELLHPTHKSKNFGKVVSAAKFWQSVNVNSNSNVRWVYYGLNPIGDAEMPLYTTRPKSFNNVQVTVTGIGEISVNTGVDSCTICVHSPSDLSAVYASAVSIYGSCFDVKEDVRNQIFSGLTNETITVCVTKQNYIPFVTTCQIIAAPETNESEGEDEENPGNNPNPIRKKDNNTGFTSLQNSNFTIDVVNDEVTINSSHAGELKIFSVAGQVVSQSNIIPGYNHFNFSHLAKGVYFVTINGKTKKIIK